MWLGLQLTLPLIKRFVKRFLVLRFSCSAKVNFNMKASVFRSFFVNFAILSKKRINLNKVRISVVSWLWRKYRWEMAKTSSKTTKITPKAAPKKAPAKIKGPRQASTLVDPSTFDIYGFLEKYFGIMEFKGTQEQAIPSLLRGKDTLVIMPTGGGKSLSYQLPALRQEGSLIVIKRLKA